MFKVLSLFFVVLCFAQASFANTIFPDAGSKKESQLLLDLYSLVADFSDYQIGDEFGKKPVHEQDLNHKTEAFARAARATAKFGGGTSFFLGKFGNEYMMATNHHVLPKVELCNNRSAYFPMVQKSFHCKKAYGTWTGIDLALFSIEVTSAEDGEWLESVGRNFNFETELRPGQELITIGFGIFQNPARELVANEDSDCKVFSDENEMRLMSDPDKINPGPYKAWSFAIGCDVSHGDSGSAIVDRVTGDVIGIIWTTATAKKPEIQDSGYLDQLLKTNSPEIWTELAYAVPAPKIREYLSALVSSGQGNPADLAQIDLLLH